MQNKRYMVYPPACSKASHRAPTNPFSPSPPPPTLPPHRCPPSSHPAKLTFYLHKITFPVKQNHSSKPDGSRGYGAKMENSTLLQSLVYLSIDIQTRRPFDRYPDSMETFYEADALRPSTVADKYKDMYMKIYNFVNNTCNIE